MSSTDFHRRAAYGQLVYVTPSHGASARKALPRTLVAASLLALAACSSSDDPINTGGQNPGGGNPPSELRLNNVSNGFGLLLPHTVRRPGTNELVVIRSLADISENVFRGNPIEPTVTYPVGAVEPDGTAGNHYIYASFTEAIDPLEVLSGTGAGGELTGAVSMIAIDPATGATLSVPGRGFVGGQTVVLENGQPQVQTWATFDSAAGTLVPNPSIPEAEGFPGVGAPAVASEILVADSTILFVADDDADLTSFETFPAGVTLRFRATTALAAAGGGALEEPLLASSTVGQDFATPELLTAPPPTSQPLITPGNGDVNVDPETTIRFEFSEPVQPYSVGEIEGQGPALLSSAIEIMFGPVTGSSVMPMNVRPISPYDLSVFEVIPGFQFPGSSSEALSCGGFSSIDVTLRVAQIEDLSQQPNPGNPGQTLSNLNTRGASTFFETAEGPGIVNAPVAPDVIFVGRTGAARGLSVVDLNGFGQSTGNPISSAPFPLEGESRFPYDPNVTQNPGIRPLLTPGSCTVDGGSAGVFTLTRDSNLGDLLSTAPTLATITDVHFAHALDSSFRNAPPPFGCQAGGGNVCSLDGLKVIAFDEEPTQPNTLQPEVGSMFGDLPVGYENIISWAPHPNPPGATFPPVCVSPFLGSAEPTSVDSMATNLLVTGNPFPLPQAGIPPTGLLSLEQNQFFVGPSFGQVDPLLCQTYQIRQQVGHFLYIADRIRSEVVVFNSNRMVVMERIPVPDPASMAVAPNLDVLAVANQLADTVTFIDINPGSATFHGIVSEVPVGDSPRGLAFEPSNEDLIVCNELDSSLSIISLASLGVRKTVSGFLDRPFEVAVTPRMTSFSFERNVYLGYILERDGSCAVFESGPNGTNGWGFDDIVGDVPYTFLAPKAIQIDPLRLNASVYVVHEGPIDQGTGAPGSLGDGAISRLHLADASIGQVSLAASTGAGPNFRDLVFNVAESLAESRGELSGVPVDLAFDNQRNLGGLRGPSTPFSAGVPLPGNNKATLRVETQLGSEARNTSTPSYLFAAVPELDGGASGVIDVLNLGLLSTPLVDVNPYIDGTQSIPAPGATVLSDYFRQ
jgi:hypothetical protein